MDESLDGRWRRAEAPFDGVTLFLPDYVPISALRAGLTAVAEALHDEYPQSPLWRLFDWHEHDGYVMEATPATWDDLRAALTSDDALEAVISGDTYVRTAWFPEGRDFLLRFYVHDPDDPPELHRGNFDVTAPEPLAARLREAAAKAGVLMSVFPAKAFFDQAYRG